MQLQYLDGPSVEKLCDAMQRRVDNFVRSTMPYAM